MGELQTEGVNVKEKSFIMSKIGRFKLLSRDQFREGTFARDKHTCVFCDKPAVDAHHIMERRLFADSGYYLENGASVCAEHHIACEQTTISLEQVREACGITKIIVPDHLYPDQPYDKWGNPLLPNGQRMRGELFFDESVQKILGQGGFLADFTKWVKFPRTHHVPWSLGVNDDDRVLENMDAFVGRRVIVTIKMDGENTTMYPDYIHARSVDGRSHPSRDWVKRFRATICADIPEGFRLVGENLFAKHSIHYKDLETYFMAFHVWNERNVCMSWDESLEWFDLMGEKGVKHVPVLYDGIYDEEKIRALWSEKNWGNMEGYVIRLADEISYGDYRRHVGKFVRKGHVQTAKHWMYGQAVEKNLLAGVKNK